MGENLVVLPELFCLVLLACLCLWQSSNLHQNVRLGGRSVLEITGLLERGAEVEEPEQFGEAQTKAQHRFCCNHSSNFISFFLSTVW